MTASPSEMVSVDTLQAKPLADAFRYGGFNGTLLPEDAVMTLNEAWNSSPLNNILMAIAIALILIYLRKFIRIFPYIASGAMRWKNIIRMENNMSISRERDSLAAVSLYIIGVCISALGLFPARFISVLSPGHRTLAVFGVIATFLMVRAILGLLCPCRRTIPDTSRTANRSVCSSLIILTAAFIFILIISSISNRYILTCRHIAIYCTGVVWLLSLLRKCQIAASGGGQFTAILYLCAMELLPAGLLVATMIYL